MTYKKNCVSCGAPIPIRRKHYNKYGSYCQKCTKKVLLNIRLKTKEKPKQEVIPSFHNITP